MSAVVTKPKKAPTHVGFGCSVEPGTAKIVVEIPFHRYQDMKVRVFEDLGGGGRFPLIELPLWSWTKIAPHLEQAMNDRLRAGKMKGSRWKRGENLVERTLGLELLLLLYVIEDAAPMDYNRAFLNWSTLKPEERWWLAAKARASDGHRGWREAVGIALLDKQVLA